jgi:hypothetical protein
VEQCIRYTKISSNSKIRRHEQELMPVLRTPLIYRPAAFDVVPDDACMLEPREADAACSTPEPLACNVFHVIPLDRDLQKARTEA